MNKIVKHILNIFVKNPKKLYSRQEIEKLVSGIGKRTIIRTLSMLEIAIGSLIYQNYLLFIINYSLPHVPSNTSTYTSQTSHYCSYLYKS